MAHSENRPELAYVGHDWSTAEPITADKMNLLDEAAMWADITSRNVETQVAAIKAGINYTDIELTEKTIKQRISDLSSQISNLNVNTISTRLDSLSSQISSVETQVNDARSVDPYASDNNSLAANLMHIKERAQSAQSTADTANSKADAAQSQISSALNGAESLSARFNGIDEANTQQNTRLTDLEREVQGARNSEIKDIAYTTVDARLEALESELVSARNAVTGYSDANDTHDLDYRLDKIETELLNARGGSADVDARLDGIESSTTSLSTDKISTSAIANNLTVTTEGYVLDARQGKALNDAKVNISDIKDGLTYQDTDKPLSANQGYVLKGLVDDLTSADTALDRRIDALETQVEGALRDENDTLDARFDAVEAIANAAAVATTVNTALEGLDARLDMIDGGTTLTGDKTLATLVSENATAISNNATAIATKANASAVTSALSEKADATTVNAISTTIIKAKTDVAYTNGVPNNIQSWTIVDKDDYLLQAEDDKYYYWKHINNEWHLMGSAGGSGTGNSNSEVYATHAAFLAAEKELNKDYYVLESDGIRHHYRYLEIEQNSNYIEIGQVLDTNNIKTYNIARIDTQRENSETHETEDVSYLNLYEFDYGIDNTVIDDESPSIHLRAQIELPKGGGGGTSTSGINKLVRIGDQTIQKIIDSEVLLRVFYSSHDSDGIESNAGTYTLKTGNTIIETGTIASGAFQETITGWKDNTAGYKQFDVTNYCRTGYTTFNLVVEVNGASLGKSWTVNIIDLHIESNAPDTLLLNSSNSYTFPYTPFGALTKTLHVLVDNVQVGTQELISDTSGRPSTYTISAQAHGAHKIELYLTAVIDNITQRTNSIIREYIWYDTNNDDTPVILASQYSGQTITASQYTTINIPYQVYKKNANTIDVYYYADNSDVAFDHVTLDGTNTGTLSYLASTSGSHSLQIKVDDQVININLTVTALNIDVSPVEGAIIDFDPSILSNSSANRLPSWTTSQGTYSLSASENFNWSEDSSGGGYKIDEDGKCFVIKAGSYVDLNYPMFARTRVGNNWNTVLDTGAEMKIIFKTAAVRNINAVWFSNTGTLTEKTVGIQLGTHVGWLKTDKATESSTEIEPDENGIININDTQYTIWKPNTSYAVDDIRVNKKIIYKCKTAHTSESEFSDDNWIKIGQIDTEVLSTNSYLYFPYSEEDKIELDININAYDANVDNNFIMSYEDGVPSKAYSYSYGVGGDGLYHSNTIRIGSPDCDVYIYRLRIYNQSLSSDDILQNFIADGADINEKVARYNRNCIYWDSTQEKYFTSPSGTAILDPVKLAERMPDVKILMLDTPVFTTGKKNYVKDSTLRCLQADNGTVYPSRGDADNWFFQNGFHAGQGTTSDNYGQSARNVDFLFEVDNTHWAAKQKDIKKSYTPSNDYVSSVLIGKEASEWVEVDNTNHIYAWRAAAGTTPDTCLDWKGDTCKVSLTESSVPNNYFNLKVNVASSENVNNALFQKRYNDFLQYNSPAYANQIAKHGVAYRNMGLDTTKTKVKNSMEFVPAVLFVRENNPDISKHTEFADTNWHFYALGNIGDSKKTDYTRAYDPDDMNEFTVENSDNNTKNGQFQSGVYMDGQTRTIEVAESGSNPMQFIWGLSDQEWNATRAATQEEIDAAAEEDGIDVRLPNGQVYVNYRHRMLYAEPFDGDHSFEFRYACKGDYRDGDLINDTTGQAAEQYELNKKVFFAFYDWLVTADNTTYAAEATQWFVPEAMEFFYAYTHYYTMMDNRAKNTFWHFAKTGKHRKVSHPVEALFHVYETSSDAVRNTSDPNDSNLWTGTFTPATGTFDANATYYTQYAFDLWVYDCDTAAGIDNNGALVFPYGKEDEDYRTEGDSLSGYAFNGAGSIFWRRLKTSFASGIREVMTSVDTNCFNSEDLIDEFDQFQNCFPEEIWRLDIERKYIRTFTGQSIDNSITTGKQNPRFLTSMMQGRKKYQRRQWIRDQGVYFNSKYRLPDIIANSNTNEFNATTPDVPLWAANTSYYLNDYVRVKIQPFDENKPKYKVYRCIEANSDSAFTASKWHESVTPTYLLSLIPYQDMYLNVQVGNGNYQEQKRAKAGQVYTYDLTGNYQETRIYINGANHLSAISGLGPMYPYQFDLRALAHLKTLDIGTDESDYKNTKFVELTLPSYIPLLETLNIKNCHSLGGTINLSSANNIREVDAEGTIVTAVTLPDYTNIESLHLPSTVSTVNLYGARFLEDFAMYNSQGNIDYSGLYTLHINDSDYSTDVDWINIALAMLEKESLETDIQLLKLSSATINDIDEIDPLYEFKDDLEDAGHNLELSGTINVTGNWSTVEKNTYETTWPNLTFDLSQGSEVNKTKVVYISRGYQSDTAWVPEHEITTMYVAANEIIPDIYYGTAVANLPKRDPTIASVFQFGSINQGVYVAYSGWTLDRNSANPTALNASPYNYNNNNNPYRAVANVSEVRLYTLFNSTPHKYTVNWYSEPGNLVRSVANQDYGGGYDLQAPTVSDIREQFDTVKVNFNSDDTVTYSIFDGWEKLPTNISPTLEEASNSVYNIYGHWYTNTISIDDAAVNGLFNDTTTPSLEQLLVLSRMNSTSRNTHIKSQDITSKKHFNYQMGFDGTKNTGTSIVNTNNVLIFDQSNAGQGIAYNNIKPFATNEGFTLAIDYKLDSTQPSSTNGAVLMGCYDKANGSVTGFALYNNTNSNYGPTGPVVGYGNMFSNQSGNVQSVGPLGYRNMIVIRHPANTSDLYIYSSRDTNSASLNGTITVSYINLSTQTLSENAVLCLGHLRSDITTNSTFSNNEGINTTGAYGTIYWAKYWNEDLGVGECQQLANWPHENMTSIIATVNNDYTQTTGNGDRPAIYLTGLNGSSHGTILTNRFDTSGAGWDNSLAKTICDNRIFNGLPIKLQSILSNIRVGHKNYTISINQYNEYSYSLSELNTSIGYVYLPSISSLDNSRTSSYDVESIYERNGATTGSSLATDITPYGWYGDAGSIEVYDYQSTASTKWVLSDMSNDYYNLRFVNKPISWSPSSKMHVYRINRSSITGNSTLRSLISDLNMGDIAILNGEGAYMYVSGEDLSQGLSAMPQSDIFNTTIGSTTEGGWIASQSYTTRSVSASSGSYNNFIYINTLGSTEIPDNSNNQPGLVNLNFAFTI